MNAEQSCLEEARTKKAPWKKWGPYLSERQWGTVREYLEGRPELMAFIHDPQRPGHKGRLLGSVLKSEQAIRQDGPGRSRGSCICLPLLMLRKRWSREKEVRRGGPL